MPPAEPMPTPEPVQPKAGSPTPEAKPAQQSNAQPAVARWLSVEQIRKQQRCRRSVVIAAMASGALPYEQRGRIRYARVCDVQAWELARLIKPQPTSPRQVHPDLAEFL